MGSRIATGRMIVLAATMIGLIAVCSRVSAQAGSSVTPSPAGTASPMATAAPQATASVSAEGAACKKALAAFGAGAPGALKELPADRFDERDLTNASVCLAVANSNNGYCELLASHEKEQCLIEHKVATKVKGMPEGASALPVLASVIADLCRRGTSDAVCTRVHDALASGKPERCKDLPDDWRIRCEAMATSDPSRCGAVEGCALAASLVTTLKKGGMKALRPEAPAFLLAARDGKKACAPLLAVLDQSCAR